MNSGGIPRNSVLILESLDRLSRNKVMSAFNVFNKIIETGIEIVTLLDGKTFSSKSLDDSFLNILEFLFGSARAREESKRKSERLSHTWEQKRRTDKVLTTAGRGGFVMKGPPRVSERVGADPREGPVRAADLRTRRSRSWMRQNRAHAQQPAGGSGVPDVGQEHSLAQWHRLPAHLRRTGSRALPTQEA